MLGHMKFYGIDLSYIISFFFSFLLRVLIESWVPLSMTRGIYLGDHLHSPDREFFHHFRCIFLDDQLQALLDWWCSICPAGGTGCISPSIFCKDLFKAVKAGSFDLGNKEGARPVTMVGSGGAVFSFVALWHRGKGAFNVCGGCFFFPIQWLPLKQLLS